MFVVTCSTSETSRLQWQASVDAVVPSLPQQLTALTALVVDHSLEGRMAARMPQLTQLTALCRLDMRFQLGVGTPHINCVVLPALPAGLTHLTIALKNSSSIAPHLLNQMSAYSRFTLHHCASLQQLVSARWCRRLERQ